MTTSMLRAGILLLALGCAAWAWSDEIHFVNNIPGTWIDISQTGTNLHLSDDGSVELTTAIGNHLLPAGRIVVGNNGGIGFNPPDNGLPPDHGHIPNNHVFGGGQALLPYWSDIGNDIGAVYYQDFGNRYIIQWNHRIVHGTTGFITMQVQIFDASEDSTNPYFQFLYQDVEGVGAGANATIGYQDGGAGFNTEEWSYNQAGAVSNGGVLSVLPEPGSLLSVLAVLTLVRRR